MVVTETCYHFCKTPKPVKPVKSDFDNWITQTQKPILSQRKIFFGVGVGGNANTYISDTWIYPHMNARYFGGGW